MPIRSRNTAASARPSTSIVPAAPQAAGETATRQQEDDRDDAPVGIEGAEHFLRQREIEQQQGIGQRQGHAGDDAQGAAPQPVQDGANE